MECYSVLKRNKLLSHGKICRNFKCINKWKEPGCILYDSNSVTFGKRQNHGDKDQWMSGIAGVAGGRKDGMNRAWRTFRAVKSLCMIPYW